METQFWYSIFYTPFFLALASRAFSKSKCMGSSSQATMILRKQSVANTRVGHLEIGALFQSHLFS